MHGSLFRSRSAIGGRMPISLFKFLAVIGIEDRHLTEGYMGRGMKIVFSAFAIVCALISSVARVRGHQVPHNAPATGAQASEASGAKPGPVPGISGQGKMKFRLLYSSDHL